MDCIFNRKGVPPALRRVCGVRPTPLVARGTPCGGVCGVFALHP